MNPSDLLKDFVSGKTPPQEFEAILYADKDLESLLSITPPLRPYAEADGLYLFLISTNYKSPGAVHNAQDALHQFLKTQGIDTPPPGKIQTLFDEQRKILPKWLLISDEQYDEIRKDANGLQGSALVAFMKDQIKKRFVCVGKPPKWLQDAFWPFVDGRPLAFVGQLHTSTLRHDTSCVYVFSAGPGKFKTIEQSM